MDDEHYELRNRVSRFVRRLLKRNFGRVALVEREVGVAGGYLAESIQRGSWPASQEFLKAVKKLGMDPVELFRRATAQHDVEALLEDLPRSRWEPSVIRRLRRAEGQVRRAAAEVEGTDSAGEGEVPDPRQLRPLTRRQRLRLFAEPPNPRLVSAEFVRRAAADLEQYRYEEPHQAVEISRQLAFYLCPRLRGPDRLEAFCQVVGVFASAQRMIGALEVAGRALRVALPLSFDLGPLAEAAMYQRAAYVLRDYMLFEEAIQVSDLAGSIYRLENDTVGLAKTFVDRGIFQQLSGRSRKAVRSIRIGIALLPETLVRSRMAAYLALATAHKYLEQLPVAEECLSRAEDLLGSDSAYDRAHLLYARAQIKEQLEDLAAAEAYYRDSLRLISQINIFDSALWRLDLIRVLLLQGEKPRAIQEANRLTVLLEPLEPHPLAAAALLDLIKAARAGEITFRQVKITRRKVEKSRTQ